MKKRPDKHLLTTSKDGCDVSSHWGLVEAMRYPSALSRGDKSDFILSVEIQVLDSINNVKINVINVT